MESTPIRARRGRLVPALLIFALALATTVLGVSGAVFSEQSTTANNDFATGSVTLATTPTDLPFGVTNMAPGDSSGPLGVTVDNTGSLEFRYAVTSTTAADNLAGQLELWVWDESQEATADGTCDATPGNGISTHLYQQGVLGSTGTTNLIGDPTQGSDAGDRTVAAGSSEHLCFFVELPLSTPDSFENQSASADFTFHAEQTSSNP